MISEYLLVEWRGEEKYSVVGRDKILDQTDREKPDAELEGKEIHVFWGKSKKKHYLAKVIQCGSRVNLDFELEQILTDLINQDANENQEKPSETSTTTANQIERILGQLSPDIQSSPQTKDLTDWKTKYEDMKSKADKYKNKVKALKRKLKVFEGEEETVQLGQKVIIRRSQLDTIKTVSNSPSIFARNLMRCIFTNEEMIGCSLFGRPCNANMNGHVKPSVDPEKRDAVILQTLTEFGGNMQGVNSATLKPKMNSMLSQIHTSLGDMIREITKKAAAPQEPNIIN